MVTTGNDYIGGAAESRFPDHDRPNRGRLKVLGAYFNRLIVICLRHPTCTPTGEQWLVRELPQNGDAPKSPLPSIGGAGAIGRRNNTLK